MKVSILHLIGHHRQKRGSSKVHSNVDAVKDLPNDMTGFTDAAQGHSSSGSGKPWWNELWPTEGLDECDGGGSPMRLDEVTDPKLSGKVMVTLELLRQAAAADEKVHTPWTPNSRPFPLAPMTDDTSSRPMSTLQQR